MNIKYVYTATEHQIYEYAKYMNQKGLESTILVPRKTAKQLPLIKNYKEIQARYKSVPQMYVDCTEIVLPMQYHIFNYKGLPTDSVVWFPFAIYDYLFNIMTKPADQKYIIAGHSMHLRYGKIIEGHDALEALFRTAIKFAIFIRPRSGRNVYYHVINSEQKRYLLKLGIPDRNIFHVPTMLDTTQYKIGKNNSKKLMVLHIGGKGKSADVVADIIREINEKGLIDMFEFYFVGERDRGIEESLSKFDNVHILGRISDPAKLKTLSSMDVLLVTAVESFSKTMLEGLLCGNYVITSRRNAASTDMKEVGIRLDVVDGRYVSEYTNALARLAKEKAKKKFNPYKIANREIIIKKHDERVILPRILDMFMTVAK